MYKKLKILLLIDQLGQGGAERQISYLACQLAKADCSVRLISFHNTATHYYSELSNCGVKIELHPEGKSKLKRPFFLRKEIKEWKPDLVIAYKEGNSMAACVTKIFCKFKLAVSERNTTQKITFRDRVRFSLFNMADFIISNSHTQKKFIQTHYPKLNTKLRVIENMIDFDIFNLKRNTSFNKPPQIITVGRISPQKNVLNFLKAIAIIKEKGIEAYFNWYGRPEYPDYYQQVQNTIESLGISDRITFHGGKDNIQEEYAKNDIFVLPSLYEGFPNVLCEAIATGLPVIASNVCDHPYILMDDTSVFNPKDPDEIANTIIYILSSSDQMRNERIARNYARIKSLCSPERFTQEYLELAQCQ